MYICLTCKNIFEEPVEWEESHGLDSPPYEKWSGCPKCKNAYIEAFVCQDCGRYIDDKYIVLNNGDCYCLDCVSQKELE